MSSKRRNAEKREIQRGRDYADAHESRESLEGNSAALKGYDERRREMQVDGQQPKFYPAWLSMDDAPRNGTDILLLHRVHGVIQGRFSQGEWSEATPDHPREYSGSAWILGDDVAAEEVEELPREHGGYQDGDVIGWLPRDALPRLSPEDM